MFLLFGRNGSNSPLSSSKYSCRGGVVASMVITNMCSPTFLISLSISCVLDQLECHGVLHWPLSPKLSVLCRTLDGHKLENCAASFYADVLPSHAWTGTRNATLPMTPRSTRRKASNSTHPRQALTLPPRAENEAGRPSQHALIQLALISRSNRARGNQIPWPTHHLQKRSRS